MWQNFECKLPCLSLCLHEFSLFDIANCQHQLELWFVLMVGLKVDVMGNDKCNLTNYATSSLVENVHGSSTNVWTNF